MTRKKRKKMLLNHIMYISRAAIEGQCEDAFAYSFQDDYGMIAVFDGCGGIGAKQYSNCEDRTAAFIAARIASCTVLEWFEMQMPCDQRGMYASSKEIVHNLKSTLDENFEKVKQMLDVEKSGLTGTLIRSFPTTASIAMIDGAKPSELNCTFLWAGDSRGYILQPGGLKQCTKDDLRIEEDAFENLYADSPLSNMLNAECNYQINIQKFTCRLPAIVFTATDGTFGYLPSPMHYEWMLVRTLCQSKSFSDWEIRLREEISTVTGDDSTLVMAIYGWNSFAELQESFRHRHAVLKDMLEGNLTEDQLRTIWDSYQHGYNVYAEDATPVTE
jgi:serine/threonine protein phosphatase PrpC